MQSTLTNIRKGLFNKSLVKNYSSFIIIENSKIESETKVEKKSIDELVRLSLSRMPKATPHDLMQPDVIQGKIYMEEMKKKRPHVLTESI